MRLLAPTLLAFLLAAQPAEASDGQRAPAAATAAAFEAVPSAPCAACPSPSDIKATAGRVSDAELAQNAGAVGVAGSLPPDVLPARRPQRPPVANPPVERSAARDTARRTAGLGALFGSPRGGKAERLEQAYPGAFRIENNRVVFPHTTMVFDDGRSKSPQELLADPDVEDMLHYDYPAGATREPRRSEDPGRVRNDAFFRALYGGSAEAVRASLRQVPWVPRLGGGTLPVTTRHGVDRQLEAVSRELETRHADLKAYLVPSAGTFMWRRIAGTDRLSVHSFGAAIDIHTKYTNYWRWDRQPAHGNIPYKNQIPREIVDVFEKYCFIWGGRWYHYDTMHFEYRPELLPNCTRVR